MTSGRRHAAVRSPQRNVMMTIAHRDADEAMTMMNRCGLADEAMASSPRSRPKAKGRGKLFLLLGLTFAVILVAAAGGVYFLVIRGGGLFGSAGRHQVSPSEYGPNANSRWRCSSTTPGNRATSIITISRRCGRRGRFRQSSRSIFSKHFCRQGSWESQRTNSKRIALAGQDLFGRIGDRRLRVVTRFIQPERSAGRRVGPPQVQTNEGRCLGDRLERIGPIALRGSLQDGPTDCAS